MITYVYKYEFLDVVINKVQSSKVFIRHLCINQTDQTHWNSCAGLPKSSTVLIQREREREGEGAAQ